MSYGETPDEFGSASKLDADATTTDPTLATLAERILTGEASYPDTKISTTGTVGLRFGNNGRYFIPNGNIITESTDYEVAWSLFEALLDTSAQQKATKRQIIDLQLPA